MPDGLRPTWRTDLVFGYPRANSFQQNPKQRTTRYRFGKIVVEGAQGINATDILRLSGIKEGARVAEKSVARALARIRTAYLERGFMRVEMSYNQEFKQEPSNNGEGILDLKIKVVEGRSFVIRRIEIVGNSVTSDYVIGRTIGFHLTDPFNPARLEASIRALNRLGKFERVRKEDVRVQVDEAEGTVDLRFHLKEKANN
jgi:outer membrane protein assembly factor BamA